MKTKHTPTPWIIETDGPAGQTGSPDIVTTPDGAYVMAECSPSVCNVEPNEAIANAAFIVLAVNAYDRLKRIEEKAKLAVDALETLQKRNEEMLKACKSARRFMAAMVGDAESEVCYALDQIIAKAEGGK